MGKKKALSLRNDGAKVIPVGQGSKIVVDFDYPDWKCVLHCLDDILATIVDAANQCCVTVDSDRYDYVDMYNRAVIIKEFYDCIKSKVEPKELSFSGNAKRFKITIKDKWIPVLGSSFPGKAYGEVYFYNTTKYASIYEACMRVFTAKMNDFDKSGVKAFYRWFIPGQ